MGCNRSLPSVVGDPNTDADKNYCMKPWAPSPAVTWCFAHCEVDDFVRDTTQNLWNIITSGNSVPFQRAVKKNGNQPLSPVVFFYNNVFDSLFNLLPCVRKKFRGGIIGRSRMLSHILFYVFNSSITGDDCENNLRKAAVAHNRRGIGIQHYSTLGLCVLYATRKCVGEDNFTPAAKYALTVKYSRLLEIMLPVIEAKTLEYDEAMLNAPTPRIATAGSDTAQANSGSPGSRSSPPSMSRSLCSRVAAASEEYSSSSLGTADGGRASPPVGSGSSLRSSDPSMTVDSSFVMLRFEAKGQVLPLQRGDGYDPQGEFMLTSDIFTVPSPPSVPANSSSR